jgi:hypothetical protein
MNNEYLKNITYTTSFDNDSKKYIFKCNLNNYNNYSFSTINYGNNVFENWTINYKINDKEILSVNMLKEIDELKFLLEEKVEEYILNEIDKDMINDYGVYIYQLIQDKAYDLAYEIIEKSKEEYDIPNEDEIVEAIMSSIKYDSFYELLEDISIAPTTIEEKMSDIGMSNKDFL